MTLQAINNEFFKKLIIIFWSIWWLTIVWTDTISVLAHLKILNFSWAPDKYNFFVDSLSMYHVMPWVPAILYGAIIIWSLLLVYLFLWASFSLKKQYEVWMSRAQVAFIVSLLLWFALFIADQLIMRYDIENIHIIQGGFQLLCFLALYILPEKPKPL